VTVSTHDMSSLKAWWEFEAGTVDVETIRRMCFSRGVSEEKLNSVFDLEKSAHGRLRWKREIKTDEALLASLGLHPDQAKDILENFHGCRDEKERFWTYLGLEGHPPEDCPPILIERAIERAHETSSIFSVHLLQEWLSIDPDFHYDPWTFRINFPGYVKDTNWRLVVPKSLEDLKRWKSNRKIRELNKKTGRS
jgi:4-alpha-glucanotransferase